MNQDYAKKNLKLQLFKLKIFLLILISINGKLKSQDISTVGEIYDFEVGDIFHYTKDYYHYEYYKYIYEITDKYYSTNYDTLYYVRSYERAKQYTGDTSWIYSTGEQTLVYIDLDSLINGGEINHVYSGPLWYNGRIINSNEVCEDEVIVFVEGCGLAWDFLMICGTMEFIHEFRLKYYKKGDEEWGTPINLLTTINPSKNDLEISIYPNPTSNTLLIDLKKTSEFETIKFFNITGELVKTQMLKSDNLNSIDISQLEEGTYVIELYSSDNKIHKKIIKR